MTTEFEIVKKRAVFFVGGFDPKSPEQFYARMDRENGRFESLWNAKVTRNEVDDDQTDIAQCRFEASGKAAGQDWSTSTDFFYMSVDDIVLKDFSRPIVVRLYHYLLAYFDYMFSGTAFKFVKYSWRFSIYFFYPAVMLALAVLLGWGLASQAIHIGLPNSPVFFWVLFIAILAILYQIMLKRYRVFHLIDLWSFSREYLRQRRADIDSRLDQLADKIHVAATSGEYDEILAVGHSTGGALILDATARAHLRHEDFAAATEKTPVCVLTVGSTSLKIGLHPAAGWFRDRLKNLFTESETRWVEFQCLTDVINFFRTDPSTLMGFHDTMRRKMQIFSIRIKNMVDAEVYRRIKSNHFRVHYQFVYGNTVKNLYDFPAFCFGPVTIFTRMGVGLDQSVPNQFLNNLLAVNEDQQ